MNYTETKKELDKIRNEYGCQGELLFRTALQHVVKYGQNTFNDKGWVENELTLIDAKHDIAEAKGKTLWISRKFEKAIIECAQEIAKVDSYNLLVYIQKEVWLSHEGGIDYQRTIKLLKYCMEQINANEDYDKEETLAVFESLGFTDDEIEEFGYGWMLEEEEE